MQALIGLERYKEAMKLYEQTSKHYFEELGVTPSEKLVEQYRYVFGRTLLEIPAGKREPGEDPLTTARRELREETGAEATHWQPLGAVLPSPGCYGEVLHLYLARGLTFGETHPDADEFLQVRRLPFDTLLARCLSDEIEDGKTVAAVLKAKLLGL